MDHGHIVAFGTSDQIIAKYGSGERLEFHAEKQLAEYIKENTRLQVVYEEHRDIVGILLRDKSDALTALNAVEESGLEWTDLQTHRDSLDEVFVKLVNRQVTEEGEIREDIQQRE